MKPIKYGQNAVKILMKKKNVIHSAFDKQIQFFFLFC